MNNPIITIEFQNMKHTLSTMLSEESVKMDKIFNEQLNVVISEDNVKNVMYETLSRELRKALQGQLTRYFQYGEGSQLIREVVEENMGKMFKKE